MQPMKTNNKKQKPNKKKKKIYRTHCSKTPETQSGFSINKNWEAMQKH